MFDIKIVSRMKRHRYSIPYVLGQLQIGQFEEELEIPICFWNEEDYENHWQGQIRGLLEQKSAISFLITQIYEPDRNYPEYAKSIEWWPIYREQDQVYIQHSFLMLRELEKEFTLLDGHQYIGDRKTRFDGRGHSEWETSLSSLHEFLERR